VCSFMVVSPSPSSGPHVVRHYGTVYVRLRQMFFWKIFSVPMPSLSANSYLPITYNEHRILVRGAKHTDSKSHLEMRSP
jgi:hypothetical protein